MGFSYSVLPIAVKEAGDFLRPIRCFSNVYSVLKNGFFDLVHTHGYQADLIGLCSCLLLGLPHMATCHGFISTDYKLNFYNKIDQISLRLSNRVVCVSKSIKDTLIRAGVGEKKVRVIQNAVPVSLDGFKIGDRRKAARRKLPTEDNKFVVGYSGRLSIEKGLKFLILAFTELLRRNKDLQLWLVGEGPQKTELRKLVDEKGISEHVTFSGFRENAIDLMMGMDVLVLPSITEGTPMVMLEAMSIGLPVVASAVGEIPQIIKNGENGLLVPPSDTIELVTAIVRIHDDQNLARLMAENAWQDIKARFSTEEWARKIEALYSEILGEKQRKTNS